MVDVGLQEREVNRGSEGTFLGVDKANSIHEVLPGRNVNELMKRRRTPHRSLRK